MPSEADIFILIDGLGWEWVKSHSFLKQIVPYRRPLRTVLGYSTAAIPSILTGRYPQEHGRLTLFYLSPRNSSFRRLRHLCMLPPGLVENRYARYAIKRLARWCNGLEGYFQLYGVPLRYLPMLEVCEKRDIYQPGGIPGSESIFDLLERAQVPYAAYSYHQGSDATLIRAMERELARGEKSFYFLYLAELDAFLHRHCDKPDEVFRVLTNYEERVARVHQVARSCYSKVRLHLFGDHGMAPTKGTADLGAILDTLNLRAPSDYLYMLDSTMARFWFFSDAARDAVTKKLAESGPGRWLSETELRSLKAWFDDYRYGQAIYLMPEGIVIQPSFMGRCAPKGMHGFHPDEPHSWAAFVSSEDYGGAISSVTDVFSIMARQVAHISALCHDRFEGSLRSSCHLPAAR